LTSTTRRHSSGGYSHVGAFGPVDALPFGDRRPDGRVDLFTIGNVGYRCVDRTHGRQLACGHGHQLAVDVPEGDRSPGAQEPLRDGAAETLRAAGDDGSTSAQIDVIHARYHPTVCGEKAVRLPAAVLG